MPTPRRAEALSIPRPVRLSPSEIELVKTAARVNHQNPSEFMRDAIVTAAGDCLETTMTTAGIVVISVDR